MLSLVQPGGLALATLGSVLILVTAASADTFNPLRVPLETITSRVETLAIEPLQVRNVPLGVERVRDAWEPLLREALEAKGYEVVAASEFDRIWIGTSKRMGGLFDPVTGEADDERLRVVREHTLAELGRLYSVDATVRARLALDLMQVASGEWIARHSIGDETVTWHDGKNVLQRPQRVVGPYLDFALVDLAGVPLYGVRTRITWAKVYVLRDYYERPESEVYFNQIRNAQALGSALEQLPARSR